MSANIVASVLKAAERHGDNVAVGVLVDKLEIARRIAHGVHAKGQPTLNGEIKAIDGDPGHCPMDMLDVFYLKPMVEMMGHLHEVAVVAQCLAGVLRALGEEIDE